MMQQENLSEKITETGYDQSEDINRKLIFNMRDLNHVMRSLYEGKASQKRILIILNEVKNITQRDLTMRLGIQPGSASEILSKLENAGLIQRTISETDRRTANISLTQQGIQMALEAAGQRSRRHVEMFSCLSEEEKERLLALLEKINADWKQRYGAAGGCRRNCRECEHKCERAYRHEDAHNHEHGHGHRHEDDHEHGHGHRHEDDHEHGHGHRHEDDHEHGHGHRHEDDHDHGHGHRHEDAHNHGRHGQETEESIHVEVH